MKILELARSIIEKYPLCNHCFGRQFALLLHGITNNDRGIYLKNCLMMEGHALFLEKNEKGVELLKVMVRNGNSEYALKILQNSFIEDIPSFEKCYLCGDKFNSIGQIAKLMDQKIQNITFSNFLVGTKIPIQIIEREDELRSRFCVKWGETIRNEFSRELGKELSKITQKEVEYKRPELVVMVNPYSEEITVQINPLFIYGRYRKLEPNIPQSTLVCSACGGKGCPKCEGLESSRNRSVEAFIAAPFLRSTGGNSEKFHAAGREGANTRVLGLGRPFVLEIKNPLRRELNLAEVSDAVREESGGKIEIGDLKYCLKEVVRRLKAQGHPKKTYRLEVLFENPLSEKDLEQLEDFVNIDSLKKTEVQISKGELNKQEKQIYDYKMNRLTKNSIEILVTSAGSQIIKELIGKKGEVESTLAQYVKNVICEIRLDIVDISWN